MNGYIIYCRLFNNFVSRNWIGEWTFTHHQSKAFLFLDKQDAKKAIRVIAALEMIHHRDFEIRAK